MSQVQVVHAIIKQSDKFLLGKRSATKKNAAGYWASVGGRLEDGESLEVGLIRECLEEIGVNVKPVKQIKQLTEAEAAHFWFEVEIVSGTPRIANDEHSELEWFTKSEAELLSPIVAEDFECIQLLDKTKIFEFRPLERKYFELLYQWLQKPHVLAWWDSENNWEDFEKRHQSMINNPLVFPHIVYKDKNPIGYINYWFVEEDPDFKPYFQKDTVGTDQFIGASELIGKGIGSDFIRQFTDELLLKPNIGLVITDPDPQNLNAIRAYEKAGFKKTKIMKTSEGEVQILEKRSGNDINDFMNIRIQNGFEDRRVDWIPDVSIIIDVFRASTTALAILEKRPAEYLMVNELDLIKDLLENSYRLISEVYNLGIDNSPTLVRQHLFSDEKIVHKTTNLTIALEKNYLNRPMLICCFNNIDTVVKHLIESNYSNIEIIAAGKMKTQKEASEDTLCAKMLANKLKNGMFGVLESPDSLLANLEEKKVQLNWPQHYVDDIKHATRLNLSDIIPTVKKIRPNLFQVSTL